LEVVYPTNRESKPGAPGLAVFETLNSQGATDSKRLIPFQLDPSDRNCCYAYVTRFSRHNSSRGFQMAARRQYRSGSLWLRGNRFYLRYRVAGKQKAVFWVVKDDEHHSKTTSQSRKLDRAHSPVVTFLFGRSHSMMVGFRAG
jgi:hypothetical protein